MNKALEKIRAALEQGVRVETAWHATHVSSDVSTCVVCLTLKEALDACSALEQNHAQDAREMEDNLREQAPTGTIFYSAKGT